MSEVGTSSPASVSRPSNPTRQCHALSVSRIGSFFAVKDLVSRERAITLEVLLRLIEVERRRLRLGR